MKAKVDRVCRMKKGKIRIPFPRITCDVVVYVDCSNRPTVICLRHDMLKEKSFVRKECKADMMMVMEEMKKVPNCSTLNREFSDSKLVVNKEGKKLCADNEQDEFVGLLATGESDNITCNMLLFK